MDDRTVIESMDKTVIETAAPLGPSEKVMGWLTVWSGFFKGRDFQLRVGRNFVGADRKCEVCIPDIHFPTYCFNIRIQKNTWTLIDLDSDTGAIVREQAVFRGELLDEDWIKAGNIVFRVKKR